MTTAEQIQAMVRAQMQNAAGGLGSLPGGGSLGGLFGGATLTSPNIMWGGTTTASVPFQTQQRIVVYNPADPDGAKAAAQEKKDASAVAWLDRRVNELRVRL